KNVSTRAPHWGVGRTGQADVGHRDFVRGHPVQRPRNVGRASAITRAPENIGGKKVSSRKVTGESAVLAHQERRDGRAVAGPWSAFVTGKLLRRDVGMRER